jgi:hypothetical protein
MNINFRLKTVTVSYFCNRIYIIFGEPGREWSKWDKASEIYVLIEAAENYS